MPTFQRCPKEIEELATSVLNQFETHKPLIEAKVKIDFVFAYSDKDEDTGQPLNDALTKNGAKALGIARKIPLKDRALGRGDAEITLDGDWWKSATQEEQRGLLDHELHHLALKTKNSIVQYDDLGRPLLKLRKHDVEVGWFKVVAERHGQFSQERIQASKIMAESGQYFWPQIAGGVDAISIEAAGKSVTMSHSRFSRLAKDISAK